VVDARVEADLVLYVFEVGFAPAFLHGCFDPVAVFGAELATKDGITDLFVGVDAHRVTQ